MKKDWVILAEKALKIRASFFFMTINSFGLIQVRMTLIGAFNSSKIHFDNWEEIVNDCVGFMVSKPDLGQRVFT